MIPSLYKANMSFMSLFMILFHNCSISHTIVLYNLFFVHTIENSLSQTNVPHYLYFEFNKKVRIGYGT